MLEIVKKSLRVDDNEFNDELNLLIEAAVEDLISSGVASSYFYDVEDTEHETISVSNKLLKFAIVQYCKSMFGYDNPDSEKVYQSYEHVKKKVAIHLRSDDE